MILPGLKALPSATVSIDRRRLRRLQCDRFGCSLLAGSFGYAQNPGDMKPATSNVFDAQYPKVQHIFYESSGTDHEWQTWRRDLKDLLRVCSNPAAQSSATGGRLSSWFTIPDFRAVKMTMSDQEPCSEESSVNFLRRLPHRRLFRQWRKARRTASPTSGRIQSPYPGLCRVLCAATREAGLLQGERWQNRPDRARRIELAATRLELQPISFANRWRHVGRRASGVADP